MIYFAPVRREMAAKGFSKATIDALEAIATTAQSAATAGTGGSTDTTDLTALQALVAQLQTELGDVEQTAADAPFLAPVNYFNPDDVIQVITDPTTPVTDLGWFNVKTYGARGDGATDDTTAIQAAIDACATAGGGTVYFPRGVYIVGGALQDTSRSNAQLLLPRILYSTAANEEITIELRGEAPSPTTYSVVGSTPLSDNLSVIKGTLNTASGTAPCLIGAHGPSGSFNDFSNIRVVLRDLTVRMPADPALTAVDCSCCGQLEADNLMIDASNWQISSIAAQSTSTSYGLRTPGRGNGASTRLAGVTVVGFYTGLEVGEHCNGLDVNIAGCKQAAVFPAQDHASHFGRMLVQWCQNALVFTGDHYVDIVQLDIEHAASGTWVPVYDIDDASNHGHGNLRWHVVKAGVGPDSTFTVNGAANLIYSRLGDAAALANNSVTYAKIQDVSAASRLLGRGDSGSGDPQEIALGTGLAMSGTTLNVTSSAAYLPLVTGAEPPVLVSDGAGHLIAVGYTP